jgi:G6PDH family F420-dependent oxidoreductase
VNSYGYSLMCEAKDPRALVDEARMAEAAGFSFVTISDHIHPWLYTQQHSGYAWSILGALAAATARVGLVTMVTCPTFRYHPVIVAQKAATMGLLSGGRFTLGLGSGERLNEHVTGAPWPSVDVRRSRLAEAVEIIQRLHRGGYVSYRGTWYDADDVRIFDLPAEPIDIFLAAAGRAGAAVAADAGAGVCNIEPEAAVVDAFVASGGDASRTWAQIDLAWAPSEEEGLRQAHGFGRFAVPGWKVMSELPNPVNFEAATANVRPEDMADAVPAGPDPERHLAGLARFHDAGYHNVAVMYPGDDVEGFMRFWHDELRPTL